MLTAVIRKAEATVGATAAALAIQWLAASRPAGTAGHPVLRVATAHGHTGWLATVDAALSESIELAL
jgi:hypothetical protein